MVRSCCYDENGIKKGTWSKEEDEKLKAYVTKYGSWNWRLIPKFAGLSRSGKSCRLRWLNYLRSDIKRGNFLKEEDETILRLHKTLGNRRWSAIAVHLPGRTDNEIKNHWHTKLKKLSDQKPSTSQVDAANSCSEQNTSKHEEKEEEEELDESLFVLSSETPTTDPIEANYKEQNFAYSMELGGNLWTDPFIFEDTSSFNNNPIHVPMDLFDDFYV